MLLLNDIDCIQTQSNIAFANHVQPIPLSSSQIGGGASAVASGWGQTSVSIPLLMRKSSASIILKGLINATNNESSYNLIEVIDSIYNIRVHFITITLIPLFS